MDSMGIGLVVMFSVSVFCIIALWNVVLRGEKEVNKPEIDYDKIKRLEYDLDIGGDKQTIDEAHRAIIACLKWRIKQTPHLYQVMTLNGQTHVRDLTIGEDIL